MNKLQAFVRVCMILLVFQAPAAVFVGGSVNRATAITFTVLQVVGFVFVFLPSHPWRLRIKSSPMFSAANTYLGFIFDERWLYADVALSTAVSLLGVQRHDFFDGLPTLPRLGVVLGLMLLQLLPCAVQPGPVLNVRGVVIPIAGQFMIGLVGVQLVGDPSDLSLSVAAALGWLFISASIVYVLICTLLASSRGLTVMYMR